MTVHSLESIFHPVSEDDSDDCVLLSSARVSLQARQAQPAGMLARCMLASQGRGLPLDSAHPVNPTGTLRTILSLLSRNLEATFSNPSFT